MPIFKEGVILVRYLDDLFIFVKDENTIKDPNTYMGTSFICNDFGTRKQFLGIAFD